jgi:predicted transcriptional regulator
MPALVFVALLTADDDGLTADELATRLQVSRAAISGAVNYLSHIDLVTREHSQAHAAYRYVLQDPSWCELLAHREDY